MSLRRFASSRKVIFVGVLLATSCPMAWCAKDDKKDQTPGDYLNAFAKRGKDSMNSVDPALSSKLGSLFPENFFEDASHKAHALFDSGAPGQIGYGFMMGYSSGFCLKKISKVLAFGIGGLFIIMQTLAYNGFMSVNYDKMQKEAEKVLDVNHDGKVDMKDAEMAYANVQKVLGYHMPTGGGFASGLLVGLRS